jgi:hypothetical protein
MARRIEGCERRVERVRRLIATSIKEGRDTTHSRELLSLLGETLQLYRARAVGRRYRWVSAAAIAMSQTKCAPSFTVVARFPSADPNVRSDAIIDRCPGFTCAACGGVHEWATASPGRR